MIVQCDRCGARFEDEYRSTVCPHSAFPANDGSNVFTIHEEAYLDLSDVYDADYFLRGKESGKSLYHNYRWMPQLTKQMVNAVVAYLGIEKGDAILDFGCARGYVVRALLELGYNAWGYDISQWAMENADESVRDHLVVNEATLYAGQSDWVIAKDVLEHVESIGKTIDRLKRITKKGILAIVPLAHGREYDVPEYENDVTHIHRQPLQWWVGQFHQPGWSVEARYRVEGIKDNYAQYPTGNGFIVARRI